VTDDSATAERESRVAADLVARIARHDAAAEAELCLRYRRGILFMLRHRGAGDDAEDICQDTLVIALEKLRVGDIDDPSRLSAWLRSIAMHRLINGRRTERRRATAPDCDAVSKAMDAGGGPFDHLSAADNGRAVQRLLDELPTERDRDVLISVYLRDEDRASICQRLELDATHFNRVLSRAKTRLRRIAENQATEKIVRLGE